MKIFLSRDNFIFYFFLQGVVKIVCFCRVNIDEKCEGSESIYSKVTL